MIIRCPQCEYTRTIKENKVPPTAEMATCPKCGHRFRFRTVERSGEPQESHSVPPPRTRTSYPEQQYTPEQEGPLLVHPQSAVAESSAGRDIWEAMDTLHTRWQGRDESLRVDKMQAAAPPPQYSRPSQASWDNQSRESARYAPAPSHQEDFSSSHEEQYIDNSYSAYANAPSDRTEAHDGYHEEQYHEEQYADTRYPAYDHPSPERFEAPAGYHEREEWRTPQQPFSQNHTIPDDSLQEHPGQYDEAAYTSYDHAPHDAPQWPQESPEQYGQSNAFHEAPSPRMPSPETHSDAVHANEYTVPDSGAAYRDGHGMPGNGSAYGNEYEGITDQWAHDESQIPWERPTRKGWLRAFAETVQGVMLHGPAFFALATPPTSLAPGYLFFLVMGYLAIFGTVAWTKLAQILVPDLASTESGSILIPALFILAPILLGLMLLFMAGCIRIIVRLFDPEQADFGLIYTVVSYSVAPFVLSIVPFVGPVIAAVWFTIALSVGCRHALRLSWGLALPAAFFPAILLLGGIGWYFL